jgi:hypothetical protein
MSPEISNPARILLFGKDEALLETRAKVLRSVDMVADIALHVEDFSQSGSLYDGVVCCYTATEAECKEISAMTDRNRTPLLKLQRLLSPLELIRQVSSMVRARAPRTQERTDTSSR